MLRVLLLLLAAVCGSGVHGKRVEVLVDWRDAASKSAQEALGGISRTVSADDSILFLFPTGPGLAVRRMDYEEYAAGMQRAGAGCRSASEVAAEEASIAARLNGVGSATAFTEDEADEVFELALAAEGVAAGWLQVDLGEAAAGEVLYFGTAATDAAPSTCYRAKIRVGRAKPKPKPHCLAEENARSGGTAAADAGTAADPIPEEVKHSRQAALLSAVFNPPRTKAAGAGAGADAGAGAGAGAGAPPSLATVDLMYSGLFVATTVAGSGLPHNADDGDRDCAHVDKGYTAAQRTAQTSIPAGGTQGDTTAGPVGVVDVAGTDAKLSYPWGTVWVAGVTNAVLVSESGCAASAFANDRISLVRPSGRTTVVAGGFQGYRDGVGEAARFRHVAGMAVTPDGTVAYIADMGNNCIRRLVLATGAVTTVAGAGHDTEYELPGGHRDGPVADALFWHPEGLALDPRHNILYVSDTDNHRIRAIDLHSGIVTTVAGHGQFGSVDGRGSEARFKHPSGLAIDLTANVLYVADAYNHRVRYISLPDGGGGTDSGGSPSELRVQTLAGSVRGYCDGHSAFTTLFDVPQSIAVDPDRHIVYVADALARKVRAVSGVGHPSPGSAVTVSGVGTDVGSKDGSQDVAEYNAPFGLAISHGHAGASDSNDGSSNDGGSSTFSTLFVADHRSHRLRGVAVPYVAKSAVQYDNIGATSATGGADGAGPADGSAGTASPVNTAGDAASIGLDQAAAVVGGYKVLGGVGALLIISVVWSNFAAAGAAAGREKDD